MQLFASLFEVTVNGVKEMTALRWTAHRTPIELSSDKLRIAKKPRTAAFTLVELLVVIAIIGILVALLLPAIQAARESARRTQCINQIHQLTLALQNYHDAKKGFPVGVQNDKGELFEYPRLTWMMHTFPYLEEGAVFGAFNWQELFFHTRNATPGERMLGEFPVAHHQPEILCGIYFDEKAIKRIARDELLADISKYMRFFNFQNSRSNARRSTPSSSGPTASSSLPSRHLIAISHREATLTNFSAVSS